MTTEMMIDAPLDKLLREDQSPAERLALARALLQPEPRRDPAWPALVAAAFLALSATVFAASAFFVPQGFSGSAGATAAGQ